jgi:hypothetical protein
VFLRPVDAVLASAVGSLTPAVGFLAAADILLATVVGVLVVADVLLPRKEPESGAMNSNTHLQVPISQYLYDVRNLAMAVTRHSKRLSAASEGRIHAGTADKMLELAEEVLRLGVQRHLTAVPSAQPLLKEAMQIISSIRERSRLEAV